MFEAYLTIFLLFFGSGGALFLVIAGMIYASPPIMKLIEKLNLKIIGGIDRMGNINVKEASKKNERNIIIIGIVGILVSLTMLGLSIWFLITQLDIANKAKMSVGPAIGGFIGMLVGITLFITLGALLYSNAIRNVYIRNTIHNKVDNNKNSNND